MLSSKRHRNIPPHLGDLPKPSLSAPTTNPPSSGDMWMAPEPTSPALSTASFMSSVSWAAEKSATELVSLLKNTYSALREKEKDLTLAAEIGKSLLENNMSLKSKYEDLLQQVQGCQQQVAQDDGVVGDDRADFGDPFDNNDDMHIIPRKCSREAIIESLERKNLEMQQMLDRALHESETVGQDNEKKSRKLQSEIELLRSSLETASQKIQEMEERQARGNERARRYDERELQQMQLEDEALLQGLTERIAHLQVENEGLFATKQAVEKRLSSALKDLSQLRHQFEQFEFTQRGYDSLQDAYERQFKHISELTESLEEHRNVLSRLKRRGLWSPHAYATSECSTTLSAATMASTTAPKQSLLGELEHAWHKDLQKREPTLRESKSESVSYGSDTHLSDSPPRKLRSSSSFAKLRDLAVMTERNLSSFCNAPGNYALETFLASAGIHDRSVVDEAVRFLQCAEVGDEDNDSGLSLHNPSSALLNDFDCFDSDASDGLFDTKNLYPRITTSMPTPPGLQHAFLTQDPYETSTPTGVVGRIVRLLRSLFRAVWRWCRFAIILATAVMINLWQGPEAMLEKR